MTFNHCLTPPPKKQTRETESSQISPKQGIFEISDHKVVFEKISINYTKTIPIRLCKETTEETS